MDMNQDMRLGAGILEMVARLTQDPAKLEAYNHVLDMPGVDAALFLLYKSAETLIHPKPLLQSTFMLGYYLCESLKEVDELWNNGPDEDPI